MSRTVPFCCLGRRAQSVRNITCSKSLACRSRPSMCARATRPWSFLLPADSGMDIAVLATTAPPGVTLHVADDGRLEGIGSGHGQIIIVHGLALGTGDFRLHDDQAIGALAEPSLVGGEMLPAGTSVLVDLPTGDIIPRR